MISTLILQKEHKSKFMKIQYAPFLLPLYADSAEQEALNRFIRTHRIVQTRRELVSLEAVPHWAVLVEYLDGGEKAAGENPKSKIDYKEILSAEDFTLFSKLRDTRKKLAEDAGLPVYAVCTNEQLAEIAKRKPKTLAECMQIDGIGQGKAEKYVPALLECVKGGPAANADALF
jgi:superfamily II DNA helicase RecQ